MTSVDLGRYKRIVQFFWDPEPKNDETPQAAIWCLGQQYPSWLTASPSHASPGPAVVAAAAAVADAPSSSSSAPAPASARPRSTSESFSSAEMVTPDTSISSSPDGGLGGLAADGRRGDGPGTTKEGASWEEDDEGGWPAAFLDDFESRIWLTYRSHFPPIPTARGPGATSTMTLAVRLRSQLMDQGGFTSDTGWGCMIRSGQSLLANALVMLRLGRDWRRGARAADESAILSLFADDPLAPFSIHRFVAHGAAACGKHPGEWFGPSATARCIQALTNDHAAAGLRVYSTADGGDVYEDGFMEVARPEADGSLGGGGVFWPTLVLVGIRLGIDRVTPVYWDALKASLQMPQSLGIAGGRPSSSHYFIGVQSSQLFFLDPHQTRPALPLLGPDTTIYAAEQLNSCHSRRLRRLHLGGMDPSMLLAFLIRSEDDWRAWRRDLARVDGKAIIHVADRGGTALARARGAGPEGPPSERASALDEVEILDDDDDDGVGGDGGDSGGDDDLVAISTSEV
ncbi:MAG: Cysteine protease atg4 [Phylliscum demangeonii]|nr:MAG: Cysteine protease atg4 [Phylliscum demangeonii]